MTGNRTVVVGAGLAAAKLLQSLAASGCSDEVWLVGDEPHPPYDRPPLSKEFLSGDASEEDLLLVDLSSLPFSLHPRLGCAASSLDPASKILNLVDGTAVEYDRLVLATGSRPRRLPWWRQVAGLHELHTRDDAVALRGQLQDARRLIVVGGGFVGLEAASTSRSFGCDTLVIEASSTLLPGKVGPRLAEDVRQLHLDRGVEIITDACVAEVLGEDRVSGVELAGGARRDGDVVLSAVGAQPSLEWLVSSGVADGNGVAVDEYGETSAPGVYAIGDIAAWCLRSGETGRVEHWTSATEQAAVVAANLMEPRSVSYQPVRYFWSDQYALRIQMLGTLTGGETEHVVRHKSRAASCYLYEANGRVEAVGTVAWPAAYARLGLALREGDVDVESVNGLVEQMGGVAA